MKIPRNELAKIIGERTLHIKDPSLLAREVAAYLLTENRIDDLDSLLRDIMQYRMDHGVVEAVAVSAHELDDVVHKDIQAILKTRYPEAKGIIVRDRQDPKVIGGVRIQLANEQLDLTVQSTLNKFKQLTAQERNTL